MSKPAIQVVTIKSAMSSTKNADLQVTTVDGSRIERIINLSEQAQDQLIRALLTGPPFPDSGGDNLPRKFQMARNVRVAQMSSTQTCLEIRLGDQTALHILLPGILAEGLKKALLEMFPDQERAQSH